MLIPIVCSCGRAIDDIYEAFKERRAKEIKEFMRKNGIEVATSKLSLMPLAEIFPPLNDVLNDYCVTRECCRATILTSIVFYEMFKGGVAASQLPIETASG